jgi:integrase/recombinase XerD
MGDVNLKTGRVMVRGGKGGNNRVTALGERSRRLLRRYVALELADAPADARIWNSQTTGERLTTPGLQLLLRRLGEKAGVAHCHPHTFRRECALMLHRSGARLTEIAALLGHSHLPTLQRYLPPQGLDAEDAHHRHGPVDGLGLGYCVSGN